MKEVFATIIFNFACIVVFSIIYIYLEDHFICRSDKYKLGNQECKNKKIIDFVMFATTVQAGVGLSDLLPNTFLSKVVIILQQFIIISSYLFIIYFFLFKRHYHYHKIK